MTKAHPQTQLCLLLTLLTYFSSSVGAEGVLEINQSCALNGGCFPGDSEGFPVTITQSGSYRLTGRLDLSGIAPTTAVQVSAPAVHLDLNGFEIIGPTTCTGSGATLLCNPTGTGQGVEFFTVSIGSSVSNGVIRGFGDSGVSANPEGIRISTMTAVHNGNDGFAGVRSALIENCVAMENGGDGFDTDAGSVLKDLIAIGNGNHGIEIDDVGGVVSGSTSKDNGGRGFNIVALSRFGNNNVSNANQLEDSCAGGICSKSKRYYITNLEFNGSAADDPANCVDGFHFASAAELHDFSNLVYDGILGQTTPDAGKGPPFFNGWIRTGADLRSSNSVGANCSGWNSNFGSDFGTLGRAVDFYATSSGEVISAMTFQTLSCEETRAIWCVED